MSDTRDMSGIRVVVVGGGSRIGRALALEASERGASVVVAGRSEQALREVAASSAGRAEWLPIDLSIPETIERFAHEVSTFDHLVSTVSMHAVGALREISDSQIQRAIDAKILGPLRLARSLSDQVSSGGSFTFFSGQAAWRPTRGAVVTATVNGALAFLVQALAVELAPIRVNAIAPGMVDSGALDSSGGAKAQLIAEASARNPVGRVGTVHDVVDATLMTMMNGYMTGTVLRVDGGGPLA
ncbi:SDR family oxidoreductase [Rhodococcus opacus]|uniref:SDR family oxidoreductase n=1 Tax=Rhodococcus opacus TaxID=37919 RepID=UPI001C484C53|nr:SDR family oxidoreductase [Rhodococcus opacus]MBV6760438.1 SDR family oxidoreductase [Rhodococcus opacus]